MKNIYIASCEKNGGIYRCLFEDGKLAIQEKTVLDFPMYAVIQDKKMHVLLRETDPATHFGGLVSFDIGEDGRLIRASEIYGTQGVVPCHLAADGERIYIVNYMSGNIVRYPDTVVQHKGKGPDPSRQEAPHTHFAAIRGGEVFCTDLGLDTVFLYDRELHEKARVKTPPGSGPRHLCFSEDGEYFYCVNELSNDVSVFAYNGGRPILRGTYPALPGYTGESAAAAIRIRGEYLYTSNRGADTISRFRISGDTLELLENTPCGGSFPRDFNMVGDYLICANETSDSVTVMKLEEGKPIPTDRALRIGHPLCVTVGE